MSTSVSPRDLEQLSAYLDGALSLRATANLEQRLKNELDLARAFKDLERTRALLRRAPQRRVPRQFTLTAQMVGAAQRSLSSGWNSLNWASAVASLLLVLVLISDFSVNGLPQITFGAAAPAAEEAPQALMLETAEGAADEEVLQTEAAPPQELFAEAERQVKGNETGLNWRVFLGSYARDMEIGLAILAMISGLAAWRQKNHS